MKVIALNGSPHAEGTTHKGLEVFAAKLKSEGIDTEIIHVGKERIQGCVDCRKCRELGRCVFNDIVNECRQKLEAADGIVLASPVYYGGIAGTFKSFLDRLFFSQPDFRYKIGAVAVSLRRTGGISVFQQLCNYFNLAQVIITPSIYWGVFHGTTAEEAEEDKEGLQIMEWTAGNMAWLLKTTAPGKEHLPEQAQKKRTNFIH